MVSNIELRLDAVIVAVTDEAPRLLVLDQPGELPRIPSVTVGAEPTLDQAMRGAIVSQTGLDVSYVEQLYTFGDRARAPGPDGPRTVSVAYLALVQETVLTEGASWQRYYDLLPWEDHRGGAPAVVADIIEPGLREWASGDPDREARVTVAFGNPFDGVRVLERYELLYEAQLVDEWSIDHGAEPSSGLGRPLHLDGRRIVATALGRLRGKLTYRPVVFDLLSESFTLLELQRCVEALAGVEVHKQNFRRLVERGGLVEGTGTQSQGKGRPAELFRYRPEVQLERSRPGLGQPYR